jgi:hypothetical protein
MIWLPDGDEVPDRERAHDSEPEMMQTFVWNSDGFQADAMPCPAMPKREMFTAAYDIRNILTKIVDRRRER